MSGSVWRILTEFVSIQIENSLRTISLFFSTSNFEVEIGRGKKKAGKRMLISFLVYFLVHKIRLSLISYFTRRPTLTKKQSPDLIRYTLDPRKYFKVVDSFIVDISLSITSCFCFQVNQLRNLLHPLQDVQESALI